MPRSYRGIFVALGLALSGPSYGQEAKADQPPASGYGKAELERIASAVEKLPVAQAPDAGCQPGQDERGSDLCAQWKAADAAAESARWTFWTLIAGIAGLAIGAGTLFAAWRAAHWAREAARHTEAGAREGKRSADEAEKAAWAALESLSETREANQIARDFGRAQLRPYVSFTSHSEADVDRPLDFSPNGFVRFKIKNFGQTPATDVVMSHGADLLRAPVREPTVELNESEEVIGTLSPGDAVTVSLRLRDLAPDVFESVKAGEKSLVMRVRVQYTVSRLKTDSDEILYIISKYLLDSGEGLSRLTAEERRRC